MFSTSEKEVFSMAGIRFAPQRFLTVVSQQAVRSWKLVAQIKRWMTDRYRPELHYMRGPGPKTLAKLGPSSSKSATDP
jgi:hypothetical protein